MIRAHGLLVVILAALQLGVWTDTAPRTVDAPLAAPGVSAAIDSSMFDGFGSRFALRDRAAGVEVRSREPTRGATVYVHAGAVDVLDGGAIPDAADVAVQGYPTLVRSGVVVASAAVNMHREPRAALCVLADRRLMFAAGVGSLRQFATTLLAAGCVDAVNLDGGSSAQLATQSRRWRQRGARPVPTWLVARRLP